MMDQLEETGGLQTLFDAASKEAPSPSAEFLARLEMQALREMPVAWARVAPGPFASLREALGGWKGFAGLGAACAAGLWLGISPPEQMSDYIAGTLGTDAVFGQIGLDPASGFDLAFIEG